MKNLDHIPTIKEIEKSAYHQGDTLCAELAARLIELQAEFDIISDKLEDMKPCPSDYEEYKQFFYDCFEHLSGHYPCASIDSEYDKSVIFNAIVAGEDHAEN